MTEYARKLKEYMASWFITATCQLLPKSFPILSDRMHCLTASLSPAPVHYSITCGSSVEFYIRPLHTCIEDTDFLDGKTEDVAFYGDFPVLPSDMIGLSDTIKCYKIESYDKYPGFVRLRVWGNLNYDWKYKNYEFYTTLKDSYHALNMDSFEEELCNFPVVRNDFPITVSGPSIKHPAEMSPGFNLGCDNVRGVWCPQWPKEAQGWLKRPRNNGWPTIDTISDVVQNGCHVVYVQHRSCRDDKKQWRLSFSVAEVILLHSWTNTQQIVYHLLRFFSKRELIQKNCPKEDEVLCPYHLKTLMLWTCEEMPPEWWNSSSLFVIGYELLQKLSEWLKRRYCPNYFIPEANLFHEQLNVTILHRTERRLHEFHNSGVLSDWFLENYIEPFIRRNFTLDSGMTECLVDYKLALFEFWKVNELKSLDLLFFLTFTNTHKNIRPIIKYSPSSGLRISFKDKNHSRCLESKINSMFIDLPTIQKVSCFTYYDSLLHILHTAYGLGCGEISWDSSLFVEFVDTIAMQPKIIRSWYHNFPKAYTAQSSQFEFLRAQSLMQNLTGTNSRSEFQLLSLMSKEFLKKALKLDDSKCNGIAPAALVYLAALHFATSDYQQAMGFCKTVLADHTPQKDKETLNASCLLFIGDVAIIVGLCVLHKMANNDLHYINRRLYLDLRLSPKVFAHYLTVLSTEIISKHLEFDRDFPDSAFSMDEYLKALTKSKSMVSMKSATTTHRTDSLSETEAQSMNPMIVKETIVGVLMEYALENMTSFYNVILKDFGIQCNTADCYRALYLHKCLQYDEVLHFCERILLDPDLQSNFSVENVLVLPPLECFFDRDIQSLLGFHTMFYYLSPMSDDMKKIELTADSTFEHCFAHTMDHSNELSCFLQWPYSIKCHYFLGRHFLARYLKVRCCIDGNIPYQEAVTEFAAQKTILPFEHIIRRFLLQRLHVIKQ